MKNNPAFWEEKTGTEENEQELGDSVLVVDQEEENDDDVKKASQEERGNLLCPSFTFLFPPPHSHFVSHCLILSEIFASFVRET